MMLVSLQRPSSGSHEDGTGMDGDDDTRRHRSSHRQEPTDTASVVVETEAAASHLKGPVVAGADAASGGDTGHQNEDVHHHRGMQANSVGMDLGSQTKTNCNTSAASGTRERGHARELSIPGSGAEVLQMREPHISTLYEKQDVMAKHFGVTQGQALRTQALLRLGVTDEDVRIAETLMATSSVGDTAQSKAEILLGYTVKQMSYHKALEVLGVSEAVVEEERARRLGELGLGRWASGAGSDRVGQYRVDTCGGFFAKRRRSASHGDMSLGACLPGEVAFAPTHQARVMRLEQVCHTQLSRIQQLERQLAALTASPSSPS